MDGSVLFPFGSRDFTVLMVCPALTLFHGIGGFNMIPTSSKLGGIMIAQTNNLQTAFNANLFWDARIGKTMLDIYGSDGAQLTNSAFVWATLLQFSLISQIIGATGVAHYGALPYSSLFSEDGGFGSFTVDDLVKMSGYTKSFSTTDKSFALQNSIVMDSIVSTPTDTLNAQKSTFLCSEVVTYVVLQRPFTKFSDGTLQSFQLSLHTHTNAAGFMRTDDAFARTNGPMKGRVGLSGAPQFHPSVGISAT